METRANYILVGAFTLAGLLGLVAFSLWFAKVEVQRQFGYLDLRFSSVSGLTRAAEVRFAGLPVGQVVNVRLAPERDGTVLVRAEIAGNTPVRADSIATIETLGVTGVSFVSITPGSPVAPLLDLAAGPARIDTGRSVLQSLTEDAPQIVGGLVALLDEMNALFSAENRTRVGTILANLDRASADLGQALDDFAVVTSTVATASTDIAGFTIQLDPVVEGLRNTLDVLTRTLVSVEALSERAGTSLGRADVALEGGTRAFDAASLMLTRDLPPMLEEIALTARTLRTDIGRVSAEASVALDSIGAGGEALNARFTEMEATIDAADALIDRLTVSLDTFDRASVAVEALATGDAVALIGDARAVLATAQGALEKVAVMAETDLPGILARVDTAVGAANGVIEALRGTLDGASGRLEAVLAGSEGTLAEVSATFAEANRTLQAINGAIATGEETMGALTRVFASADSALTEDVRPIANDLRQTLARLDRALELISSDLPAITGDLRSAAAAASETFAEFGSVVQAAGGPLVAFSERALPDYAELAREARGLIINLERLTRTIERDPARFIFSPDLPEYRQ